MKPDENVKKDITKKTKIKLINGVCDITGRKKIFSRICPDCGITLYYASEYTCKRYNDKKCFCRSCSQKGIRNGFYKKHHTDESKKKIGGSVHDYSGKNNPMYKKSVYDIWLKKYGKDVADAKFAQMKRLDSESNMGNKNGFYGKKHSDATLSNFSEMKSGINNPMHGKKHSDETKQRMRLSAIKYIKNHIGVPLYSKKACLYFDNLEKNNNWNGFYGTKTGEYYIKELGYWPDYYEPHKNIVIEYNEKRHYTSDGKLKEKDVIRNTKIKEFLQCKFFIYNEKTGELYEFTS